MLPLFYAAVIFAPFIEELSKVWPLFYRHGETQRSLVILGVLVGLGFGITELVLYVFVYGAPFIARLPGVIFHASSAGITAFGVAKKKPLPYYLISVALHLINNLVAFSSIILVGLTVQVIVLVTAYLLVWHFYNKASDKTVVM
jgi:RsiW-degrading membrane proteinase PrsW (M82 family)